MQSTHSEPNGRFIDFNNERFYRIENIDAMPSFFISMVSHSDHWLFISSNTGLTAGRVSAVSALFPYEAVDKIEDNPENSGNKTIIRVKSGNDWINWEPFSTATDNAKSKQRNLYKHILGNQLCFEEIHHELKLTYRFTWQVSDEFGFVVQAQLINHNSHVIELEILDGLQNILPAGAPQEVQTNASNLVDAYRCNELLEPSGLAVFSLYSGITDKPEPVEVLKANTVFCLGLDNSKTLLSSRQVNAFRMGHNIQTEHQIRGIRGAYLVKAPLQLKANGQHAWKFIANVEQSQQQIAELNSRLKADSSAINSALEKSVHHGAMSLTNLLSKADARQKTASEIDDVHHYANVLFNAMRGGVFDNHYWIHTQDFVNDIKHFNKKVFAQHTDFLESLPEHILLFELQDQIKLLNDSQLERLCTDYLPITFGRRHGDPSRPWNKFAINIKDNAGEPLLSYEGNWRDIFQNWEALLLSYPEFIENVISKFVNASTIDGYNPYRITKKGIDWEIEDPKDPWSYIGYWGDHQIIYLLKLLELSQKYHPQQLSQLLSKALYSYANVPYRIKPFSDVMRDPKNTIVYDEDEETLIQQRMLQLGADGKLVLDENNQVYQVNLLEKLLVPLLSKLSNFVPRGGIWLNTQRPEWNDANNALVGQGLSMVTLYYMRRYVAFLMNLLSNDNTNNFATETASINSTSCSIEVVEWLEKTSHILNEANKHLKQHGNFKADYLLTIITKLGQAGSDYRQQIYQQKSFSGKQNVDISTIKVILNDVLSLLDDSIRYNQRSDKLYHAYNLLSTSKNKLKVDYLYEMLEGQVSVLSSGTLQATEVVEVLESLFESPIYRADQKTFMLYPDEQQSPFLKKNVIEFSELENNADLLDLLDVAKQNIIIRDEFTQNYRFHHEIINLDQLNSQIINLQPELDDKFDSVKQALNELYKKVFDHYNFTGRSHGMFGFEGLGCIYWHMVSKLLLATQECYFQALENSSEKNTLQRLGELYYQIRGGIGFNKTPSEYGAFPYDPYSHTPMHSGAQQPGMTGQVKEEVLSRYGELGVRIENGQIKFQPSLLRQQEFLTETSEFSYLDLAEKPQVIALANQSLAFTLCQVPIIYQLTNHQSSLIIHRSSGVADQKANLLLDAKESQSIFKRENKIEKVVIQINEQQIRF